MENFLAKGRQLTWSHSLFMETIFSDTLLCSCEDFTYSWPLWCTSVFPALGNRVVKILSSRPDWNKFRERKRGRERNRGIKWGRRGKSLPSLYCQLWRTKEGHSCESRWWPVSMLLSNTSFCLIMYELFFAKQEMNLIFDCIYI